MFSAEHYIKVARVIRKRPSYCSWCGEPISSSPLISSFAEMFEKDNPLFDHGKFWDECQPLFPEEEVKEDGI